MDTKPVTTVPVEEWDDVARIASLAGTDPASGLTSVRLWSDGERRRWAATDGAQLGILDGGPETEVYDLLVPQALIRFAVAAGAPPALTLVEVGFGSNGDPVSVGVASPRGSLHVGLDDSIFPDISEAPTAPVSARGITTLDALRALWWSVMTPWMTSEADEPLPWLPLALGIEDGQIRAFMGGVPVGCASYVLPLEAAEGAGSCQIDPARLRPVLGSFSDEDDEVIVALGASPTAPLRVVGQRQTVFLTPLKSQATITREAVEEVIARTLGSLATVPDGDGDYPLCRHRVRVYGRVVPAHEPPIMQVFSVLMDDVDHSLELMNELNDLNQGLSFARLIWVDRQVLAEVDLVVHTLDDDELLVAIDQVTGIARDIGPLLQAMFGGTVSADPAEVRWQLYRQTVVAAEVTPGRLIPLNGPEAAAEWPFPGPVHVLSGWDPQGVSRTVSENEDINALIAAEVLRAGGRFTFGLGTPGIGGDGERGLVVWGLDREDARRLARRAGQDAIFEIDEATMRLVSAFDARAEGWARVPQ